RELSTSFERHRDIRVSGAATSRAALPPRAYAVIDTAGDTLPPCTWTEPRGVAAGTRRSLGSLVPSVVVDAPLAYGIMRAVPALLGSQGRPAPFANALRAA